MTRPRAESGMIRNCPGRSPASSKDMNNRRYDHRESQHRKSDPDLPLMRVQTCYLPHSWKELMDLPITTVVLQKQTSEESIGVRLAILRFVGAGDKIVA